MLAQVSQQRSGQHAGFLNSSEFYALTNSYFIATKIFINYFLTIIEKIYIVIEIYKKHKINIYTFEHIYIWQFYDEILYVYRFNEKF